MNFPRLMNFFPYTCFVPALAAHSAWSMAKPEQPNLRDYEGCEGASRGAMRDGSVTRKAPWAANGFGSTFFHKKVEGGK